MGVTVLDGGPYTVQINGCINLNCGPHLSANHQIYILVDVYMKPWQPTVFQLSYSFLTLLLLGQEVSITLAGMRVQINSKTSFVISVSVSFANLVLKFYATGKNKFYSKILLVFSTKLKS